MKKVLLSSVAALAVFAAAAPVFAKTVVKTETDARGVTTKTYDDGTTEQFYNDGVSDAARPDGVPSYARTYTATPTQGQPVTVKTADTNKHVRVTVLDGGGRPVPGATIDFMYNGYSIGSAVTNVGGDAEIEYLFNEGDVVEFRVGKTATDFKELVTATGSVTVTADMYTNGSVTLPYKLDDRAATINTNSKDVKASDNNQTKEEAKSEAQKTEKAAKAAKDGKAASAQAGKALPKTSAAK